ncbi:MAG: ankyrin repeat domain-containing protein, partial [Acidimicrobiales bacterium]
MSDLLPERPDLNQLRRRAKELRDAAREGDAAALARLARHHPSQDRGPVSLAAAQLVTAREMGFASWPVLKAAVEGRAAASRQLSSFLAASVEGPVDRAADIVRADPNVAVGDLRGAAVIGDVDSVRRMVAVDPAVAVAIDDERGWPPLLYACYSRWHQIEPHRAGGMAEVVRVLLEAGASANTNDGGRTRFRSALKGSVEVNNPDIAEVLLAAGAIPHMGQPVVEAVGRGDQRCLRLLLAHGARVAGTWALGAAIYHDDAEAASLLLDALPVDGNARADAATEALPEAVANASLPLVGALIDAGANPGAVNEDGVPALRIAVRSGKHDIAERLQVAGAVVEPTDVDRFLGACLNADRELAAQLLATHPGLANDLSDDDRTVIVDAAGSCSAAVVRLLLDMGFPADARRFGEVPLHAAAYSGNAPVVRVLLEAGADVDARDDRFDATPLAFATVGSREQA